MEPRHSRIVAHSCLFLPLRPLGAGALPALTLDGHGNRVVPNGDVVGLSNVVVEVLPTAERTEGNLGYRVLGPAPTP